MAGGRRVENTKPAVTAWLGAGAITLGIGAALTAGAAVAGASTDDPGAASNSSAAAASHESATAAPPQAHSDDGAPAPTKKPRHRTEGKDASASSTPTAGPTSTDSDAKPAATHKRSAVTRAVKVRSHDDTPTAVAQSTAADTAVPKVAALPTAKATAKPTNPVVKLNKAVQSFLHGIQVQYFNTPPRLTGSTVPIGTTSTLATAKSAAVATDPFTNGVRSLQSWIKKTFYNTAPTVTISLPTKNADGSYTGQITASDVDGDPLRFEFGGSNGSTTTVIDHGDGTYTYTFTPSEASLTKPNSTYFFHFTAFETNAATHFHGGAQIRELVEQSTLVKLARTLFPSYSQFWPPYSAIDWAFGEGFLTVPIGPVVPPTTT